MSDRIILGINDNHNASACLLKNGKLIACIQEERLTRKKNQGGLPRLAIKKCMEITNTSADDIDLAVFGLKNMPANLEKIQAKKKDRRVTVMLISGASRVLPASWVGSDFVSRNYVKMSHFLRRHYLNRKYKEYFEGIGLPMSKIGYCEHHYAHGAAAYFFSPWGIKEKTLIITSDGEGDGYSGSISIGDGARIERKIAITPMNSIASLYSRLTLQMGMKPWEHEYKIMGMAPYVNVHYGDKFYEEKFRPMFDVDKKNPLHIKNKTGRLGNAAIADLKKRVYMERFDLIMYSIQKLVEEVVTKWVSNTIKEYDIRNVVTGGGLFMNIKANKKVMELPEVEKLFVFPSCGDESTCVGAAMQAYVGLCEQDGKKPNVEPLGPLYLGPDYDDEVGDFVKTVDRKKYKVEQLKDVEGTVGEMLTKGEIVARNTGKLEWGARALGNRSIMADPRDIETVKKINDAIKNRDFWMPFTPSMLKERENDYVINPKNLEAPYMILAFDSTNRRDEIVAAIHQGDKTVRPQVVEKSWNPRYYDILKTFEKETGVGAILNTSFNIHGYPINCTPKDAFETLEWSGLEHLSMGDYLISKK